MGKVNEMAMDCESDRLESAYDRGHADRYYGRRAMPNLWLDSLGSRVVTMERMSQEEIDAYDDGWNNCTVTKDWGDDVE